MKERPFVDRKPVQQVVPKERPPEPQRERVPVSFSPTRERPRPFLPSRPETGQPAHVEQPPPYSSRPAAETQKPPAFVSQPERTSQPVKRSPVAPTASKPALPTRKKGESGRNSTDKVHAYNVWLVEQSGQVVSGTWMPENLPRFKRHVRNHPPKLIYSPEDGWTQNPNYQKGQNNGHAATRAKTRKSIAHSPAGVAATRK